MAAGSFKLRAGLIIAAIMMTGFYAPGVKGKDFTAADSLITGISDSSIADTTRVAPDSSLGDSLAVYAPELKIDSLAVIRKKSHSPSGAMWRSLAFPGWGQLYNGKYLKAAIIAGGEFSLIYGIWIQEQRRKDAKKAGDDYAANFYRDDRQRLTWWLTGLILYSMADAYVDAHLLDFDIDKDLSAGVLPGIVFVRINF